MDGQGRQGSWLEWQQRCPLRRDQVEWQEREGTVLLRLRRTDWLARLMSWLVSRPLYRQVELDEIGGLVWQLCDGAHTVGDIANALQQRYQLSRREAIASLIQFLEQLHRRGLIAWEEAKR